MVTALAFFSGLQRLVTAINSIRFVWCGFLSRARTILFMMAGAHGSPPSRRTGILRTGAIRKNFNGRAVSRPGAALRARLARRFPIDGSHPYPARLHQPFCESRFLGYSLPRGLGPTRRWDRD